MNDSIARNRAAWAQWAADYVAPAERNWDGGDVVWGIWVLPEADVGLLDGVAGRHVLAEEVWVARRRG